ncbi:YaaR family protein [Anaerovibrio sp.]|uniref:YaaR family protein n=1 Tax=Anaerovibrio sp. TaxID=1872532 RepID=UPI002624C3B2|nr:YaaR family protein [Anaerovibrio sp.]MDD6598712.1 YaaR family protein [Anaerovibrio sp.]MDD7678551.1 YaaR family protein [Anaerovibrio sp.]MDY2603023.1 YaaR family protein [Anaerovibrio sp.]MDY4883594.1 YaaR family protein [Anaerovibrio sp.]
MKIDGLGARPAMTARGPEAGHRAASLDSDFASELEDQQGNMTREQLQQMLEEIDAQGQKLTNTPTYDELKSYRSLIKNFVGTVVAQMYAVNTQAGWDRMGRQKVYTTVRKIDRELENMAEKIRLGQTKQLDIVASHDAIRGMLVDLYM